MDQTCPSGHAMEKSTTLRLGAHALSIDGNFPPIPIFAEHRRRAATAAATMCDVERNDIMCHVNDGGGATRCNESSFLLRSLV